LGYYGAVTGGLAIVAGQLGGGILVSANLAGAGWRPIFLVNVPLALAALLLTRTGLPESRATHPIGLDRAGTLLLGVSVLTLLIPLVHGPAHGWPPWCWLSLGACPIAALALRSVERRREANGGVALLAPSILRVSTMRTGLIVAIPFFATFSGFMFVIALTLQQYLHQGPLEAGLAFVPLAGGFLAMSLLTGRLVTRFGARVVVASAGVQFTAMLAVIVATLGSPTLSAPQLLPGLLLFGLAQGLGSPTLYRVILSRVPTDSAGAGSGILTTVQQASLALGVATLGSLFTTLVQPGPTAHDHALLITSITQALLAIAIALLATRLPDPRVPHRLT
jgi:MFS family permease